MPAPEGGFARITKLIENLTTQVGRIEEKIDTLEMQIRMSQLSSARIQEEIARTWSAQSDLAEVAVDQKDKWQDAMDGLFSLQGIADLGQKDHPAFPSFRKGYVEITDDPDIRGIVGQSRNESDFHDILITTMNRYMVAWYESFEQIWRKVVRIRHGIRDFRWQHMTRIGGFGNISCFHDSDPTGYIDYEPGKAPEGSYRPQIRAKMFTITEQMIMNDDLFVVTRMLEECARAADETLMTYVFGTLIGGAEYLTESNDEYVPFHKINSDRIYSGASARPLYDLTNAQSLPLTEFALNNAIERMRKTTKIGNNKPLRLYGKKYLVIPLELEKTAEDLTTYNENVEVIALDKLYLGESPFYWYLVEDPSRWEGIQLGFVDDEENPRIVLANNPTKGRTFTHGGLQCTVSHRYGGGVVGHEGLYGSLMFS